MRNTGFYDNIPDNYDLWKQHEERQEAVLAKLPICDDCEEPITDEHFFLINNKFICQECLDRDYKKDTYDYMYEV